MSQQTGTTFPSTARAGALAIIAEAAAFFLRPRLLQSRSHSWQGQLRPLLALLGLNLGVLFLLLPLLIGWTHLMGIEPPRMMRDVPEAAVLVLAVLVLPPLEEIVFRGWMSGRPAALWVLGVGVALVVLLTLVHRMGLDFVTSISVTGVVHDHGLRAGLEAEDPPPLRIRPRHQDHHPR